jgi:hypothetical protein
VAGAPERLPEPGLVGGAAALEDAQVHEHAEKAAADEAVAAPRAEARVALGPARLLRLQQTAGNRAVNRILARYEAGEHSQFGTAGVNVTINGYTFDQRYLVSMGDYYKSSDKLMDAKKGELEELVALIKRDEDARTGKGGTIVEEEAWQAWSLKWRKGDDVYMELNKTNESHFAPRNRTRWEEVHRKALKEAQSSGNGSGTVSNQARVLNGFAAHYLTDAFAAGHMIDKIQVKEAAKTSLKAGTNRETMALAVARGILATKACTDMLAGHDIKDGAAWGDWGPPTEPRLASLLASVMYWKDDEFGSVFARVAHDDLNSAIARGLGLWVENKAGDRWQLSGDATLSQSTKTLEVTRKAVQASEDNLARAAAIKSPPFYTPWASALPEATIQSMIDNVWKYVPEPTTSSAAGEGTVTGSQQVAAAVAKYTDAGNADTIAAIVKLSIDQFPTAFAQLQDKKLIRVTPPAPPPAPPAPPRREKAMP